MVLRTRPPPQTLLKALINNHITEITPLDHHVTDILHVLPTLLYVTPHYSTLLHAGLRTALALPRLHFAYLTRKQPLLRLLHIDDDITNITPYSTIVLHITPYYCT